ncbi:hypothetical protein K2173_007064 [Erythroxylum novogranatense]|uniref:Uncharacterized protein n=1 Tax=Erythroxylum novogranatense TaxID=1862640 RepID=A0AAV8SL37_9ROSI|nr:hypothetical protein K2173_007064 [Erythroxylum novogranatense]
MEETHAENRKAHEYSFSSSSSDASSSSSSSSSPPSNGRTMPVQFSLLTRLMQDMNHHYSSEKMEASEAVGSTMEWLRFINMDWKEVEKRFDRLASTGNSPEPVLRSSSDFAFCIGLQQSPEFANELLRALRGRRQDHRLEISKTELHANWDRMTQPCFSSRLKIFFDICDRDMDGRINVMDLKQAILLMASTNKLSLSHEEAQEYAGLVMEILDNEDRRYIQLHQLEVLLKISHPRVSFSSTYQSNDTYQEPMSKAETLFRSYWRRAWILMLWLVVCVSIFTWKFIQYRHRTAFEVMGYCLCTAKGAAETLKLNMALILLPVCRNTITFLRRNQSINSIVPFNDNVNFHKVIAGGIVVGVILHGGTHLACDFPRISGSDSSLFRQTIAARFGYHQPSYMQILTTTEAATGIAMVVLMSIVFVLATRWPRRQSPLLPRSIRRLTGYNTFWYSHHLLILVYALLIVHSMFLFLTSKVTDKTTWMYIAIPASLYVGERIFRAIRSKFYEVEILKASIYQGKVLSLQFQKPAGFSYRSGMYIFVQCPQISPLQWHPFSLTSGPRDDHLSVHIRALGDWSYQLYSLFQEATLFGIKDYPRIQIDGPYGAASQDHVKYDIVVLVGLGIGATPFISVLRDIADGIQKHRMETVGEQECSMSRVPLKTYFYWVTREQSSFDWFRDILTEISASNQKQPAIEAHNFLTSAHVEGDARSALIRAIQALYHAKNGVDIVSRTEARTHFGRPNWFTIFSNLAANHSGERIGVFYCGPSAPARELQSLCTKLSFKTTTRFVFHKENY